MAYDCAPCAALYVHVPLCLGKCPYCGFYSVPHTAARSEDFVDACEVEIALRADRDLEADTIYLGGGTPSLLSPDQVRRILAALNRSFHVQEGAEVTLEANPGTVGTDELGGFRTAGVNRLVLGVQSYRGADLAFLERPYDPAEAEASVRSARQAGFGNLGLDLLYGLPGRTLPSWIEQIERAAASQVEHLSCYMLTVEPSTPLASRVEAAEVILPSEEGAPRLFEDTVAALARVGYGQYEVSNFARSPAYRSRHNLRYWDGSPYLGFGPGAHSYQPPLRTANKPTLSAYVDRLKSGELPDRQVEELSPRAMALERLFLGLRTSLGADLTAVESLRPGFVEGNRVVLEELAKDGLATIREGRLVLSRRGMAVADGVARALEV